MQELTLNMTVALVAVLAAVFVFVALRSGNGAEFTPIEQRAGRLRVIYFWALLSIMLVATIVTLSSLPYPRNRPVRGVPQVVNALAHQWYWEVTPVEVEKGRTVEFRVTAADVNHGFGLYDSSLRLVAQTQAMPGYINVMHYTFEEPGTYTIQCLEYCGVAHHAMQETINVKAPQGESGQ
jgi:cytochrome c oxidase subunit 2